MEGNCDVSQMKSTPAEQTERKHSEIGKNAHETQYVNYVNFKPVTE